MLERVRSARKLLEGVTAAGLGRVELCDAAVELGRLRSRIAVLDAEVAAAGDGLVDKPTDGAGLVAAQTRRSGRAAKRLRRRTDGLEAMPAVRDRLSRGELNEEHVDHLIGAAEQISFTAVDSDEHLLAAVGSTGSDSARATISAWTRTRRDDKDAQARQQRRRDQRRLSISTDDDGMTVIHGLFDPVTGAQLKSAIDTETDRLWHSDGGRNHANQVRSPEQRRADATTGLILTTAGQGRTRPTPTDPSTAKGSNPAAGTARPHPRTQVMVLVDADVITGTNPDGGCEIPGVGPIPVAELERLACDASIFGIIFSGHGDPLWHSRETRLATDAQWRALIARDRGCVICGAEPLHCHAHHLKPWQAPARGPTDIDNLALVCVHHHHQLHTNHQTLTRHGPDHWRLSTNPNQPADANAA